MEQESLDAFREIDYVCSGDHSRQGAMVLGAAGEAPRPLLVALHTWSFDFRHPSARGFAERCAERNWHLIFPNFRGPNNHPEGCGSELAVSDIVDAVRYMCERFPVDESRVYLTGGSGGGYGTLLLAGRHPELWAAASAWCPISDLVAWHRQCRGGKYAHYSEHIEASCGGDPQSDPAARQEAERRSALTHLAGAAGLPLDIATGIHDGHSGSVPVSQAIYAFNLLAKPEERFSEEEIEYIVRTETVPPHLSTHESEPLYGEHTLLLRRVSGSVRLSLFEGAHDMLTDAAFAWLEKQRRGCSPDWSICDGIRKSGDDRLSF